jgi:hypothetical protein
MRQSKRAFLVALSLSALAISSVVPAPAQASVSSKVKKSCTGDYKRLCPRYKVGSPQLRACMEAKSSEISSACINALIDSGEVNRSSSRRR